MADGIDGSVWNMQIVVTGGAGFIGSNLVRKFISQGDQVTVVDNFSTGTIRNIEGTGARIVEGSILDPSVLDAALEGSDCVVHLAARPSVPKSILDPMASHEANATGTLQVLESARRCGRPQVIVASSSSVYGSNPVIPKSEDLMPMPISPYAVSKLATESYAISYKKCFNLDTLAFRFFNVYGPFQRADHDYAAVIPAFLSAALAGRPLPVYGDGLQTRDFTYVGTVVEILSMAAHGRVSADGPVNLAFGTRASLLDLVGEIERALGRSLECLHLESRPGDVRDSQADQTRLIELFGMVQPTSLSVGLEETIEWFRQDLSQEPK